MDNQGSPSKKINIICKNVFKSAEDKLTKQNYNQLWVELIHQIEKEKATLITK